MKNECLQVALRELASAGIRDVTRAYGGKHLQLRWRVNGSDERMYSIPVTPSDVRSPHNTRAQIRRMLRADGLLAEPAAKLVAPARQPSLAERVAQLERRLAVLEKKLGSVAA